MARRKMGDAEIKVDIMNRLLRKHCWGAKYLPLDTLVNWLSKQMRRNGKRVRRCVAELAEDGYVLFHKRGETISLNSVRSREIIEYVKSVLKS